MNSRFDIEPEAATPAALAPTQPMVWSVRRELWENKSLYVAPLVVTAVVLFASILNLGISYPGKIRNLSALDPARQHSTVIMPFSMAPAPIMFATFLVGMFYALDALYGERRDRSILFWKSLPVSDRTTVLSKLVIPLVVLPSIAAILSLATVAVMIVVASATLTAHGLGPAILWSEYRFFQEPIIMVYGLGVHSLWFAPIYGYLLLVSAWARRAPFLWAILPLFTIGAVERIVFSTSHFASLLRYRWFGAMETAFTGFGKKDAVPAIDRLASLTPFRFFTTPGLWIGLAFAAACIAAAVRLRRYREPI